MSEMPFLDASDKELNSLLKTPMNKLTPEQCEWIEELVKSLAVSKRLDVIQEHFEQERREYGEEFITERKKRAEDSSEWMEETVRFDEKTGTFGGYKCLAIHYPCKFDGWDSSSNKTVSMMRLKNTKNVTICKSGFGTDATDNRPFWKKGYVEDAIKAEGSKQKQKKQKTI